MAPWRHALIDDCSLLAPALTVAGIAAAGPAEAASTPHKYSSCKALNKVYSHGVGRRGAHDKVSGGLAPVTNFTVYNAVYKVNAARLDRDRDGIACEHH